ncbi:ulp1 protease family, C-terminal catalytic domain-containing protein [Artemisia annua]|uniref:Ulp1 protease family, C-terminal catalytic domain-containing protein n=1 Tax=Artemisia annua TaxID=35608 RepID=A0A2U1N454_ARTAN|nr:ulp1 protease family, C-terminal catalytic domain-containing protein [Artemisia annua]
MPVQDFERFWSDPRTEIKLARDTGVKVFRMGIDWTRIMPKEPVNSLKESRLECIDYVNASRNIEMYVKFLARCEIHVGSRVEADKGYKNMNIIEDYDDIGDLPPILIVRRSKRVSDQMGKNDGQAVATIDLTSDQEEMDDVSGIGFHGGNRRTRTTSVPVKKRPVGSLEGDVFLPSLVGDQQKDDEGGVVEKGKRKRSKFFIVAKDKVGKKGDGKRKLSLNKRNGKKGKFVGEDVPKNKGDKGVGCKDVPTRLSYWLLENFDEDRCVLNVDGKDISITRETVRDVLGIPMGNVPVKAVDEADCRHPLVIEWKRQFGSTIRYKHIPVEKQIYTQADGGWMFKLNFLVLYFTSIGESNKNATVNLRFFNCIEDENDIPGFDWCSYVLECLVRTKKSWIRTRHFCGPVIVLLVVYAESMRKTIRNGDVQMPLVNSWTVDLLNKLEAERLSPESVEASQISVEEIIKSLAEKYQKAGELMHDADGDLDEALEANPTDERLLQMKEMRDAMFRERVFREPANESTKATNDGNDGVCTPENDVPNTSSFKDAPDEPFPFTQFYGTPSAYVAYSEQVSLERSNKEKRLRSDQVNISKFDLNITQPPATQGRSVDATGGDRSIADAEELLESLQVYDSQDLPHFDCFTPEKLIVGREESGVSGNVCNGAITPYTICDQAPLQTIMPKDTNVRPKRFSRPAEVLCSPWFRRACSLVGGLAGHEKRVTECLFSGRFSETDILFETDYVCAPRIVFESLCPGIKISSEVVDMFTKVLNDAEKYRDPKKLMCKVFCDTSLMREWDVMDLADKKVDVKESSDKFIKGMMGILRTTVYGSLANVDLVFFPIIQAGHFFVVCVHLKRKEVHILDNMLFGSEDVSDRYGGLVGFLVARFEDFLSFESHPAQGFLRSARPQLLRLGCMTKNNVIDCGVFAMRHMETYLFGGEYDDLCEFRREGKDQQHQLDELRCKYAAKILLADINNKKADFEEEAEAYKRLPLEERKRLEAASYETVKVRVGIML